MKIRPEHVAHMQAEMQKIANQFPAMREWIATDPRVKDADKRLRWDAMYKAGLNSYICATIYPYANDDHIDTALRQIMKNIV